MATTPKEDAAFRDSLIPNDLLEYAIEWIRSNLSPDQVFEEKILLDFASNYDPGDVFNSGSLSDWAENNGYVKE